jgi:anti-sigma B factor antagonist
MQTDPLSIETQAPSAGTRILKLIGPLTLQTIFAFREQLRSEETPLTIVDLSQTPYMDSAGMGELINFYVHSQKNGRRLIVAAPNYRVIELFRLTRVDSLITIAASLEEAQSLA